MADDLWGTLLETAGRRGDAAAIVRGDRSLTFAAWARRGSQMAARLRGLGVDRGGRVLVWSSNEPDVAAALAGAWALGAIPALMDASSREGHLLHAVEMVAPSALVHAPGAAPPGAPPGVPTLSTGDVAEDADELGDAWPALPTDPASIVFTSGSTGRPKGVVQSHGNLIRGCRAVAGYLGLTPEDRILCPVPWAFDYGYGQLLSTVVLGATHVLADQNNPFGVCRALAGSAPTVLAGVPSLYAYLVQGLSPIRQTDVGSVRMLTSSGGRIPSAVRAQLREIFPGRRVVLNYGLTETYRTCTLDPSLIESRGDTIGRPIPGADVAIVRDDGTLAAPGEEGEIVHRGDYVCLGYWGDPEATARAIRPDPLAPPGLPGSRALFTGDYGTRGEDGFVTFRGRRDHQIKSMGVRVSPTEVEEALHASGLVAEAAAFGVPHDLMGQEVWAAVVPADGRDAASLPRALAAHARAAMSPYMQPRRYLVRDALPRTTNRKVDYPALRAEAASLASASPIG